MIESNPDLEVLPAAPSESSLRAQKRLASEVMAGWRAGEPIDARAFLDEHRDLPWDKSIVMDVAFEAYCLRTEAGEQVDVAEFCEQFPDVYQSLWKAIDVQRFVASNVAAFIPSPPERWPESGEAFLGFHLIEELGRGAYARVFLAEEEALGHRRVAVKIVQYGAGEAATLGRLQHENIVPIHSVSHDPATGLTALCMPFVSRSTLYDILRAKASPAIRGRNARQVLGLIHDLNRLDAAARSAVAPAPLLRRGSYVTWALSVGVQLAEALAASHASSILHLDMKPPNVLITTAGRAMLLDFNLSRQGQAIAAHVGGTLPYMSQEQLLANLVPEGEPCLPVDARADLFALGAMLFEMLSGSLPFGPPPAPDKKQKMVERLIDRQRTGPLSLSRLNADVDEPLAATIASCLAFDPEQRPQSAKELAAALRKHLSRRQRVRRWARSHRRTVVAAAAVLTAICLASFGFFATRDPYAVRQLKQGQAAYDAGHYEAAMGHFNRTLEADPENCPARIARGKAYQKQGEYELALKDFRSAEGNTPDGALLASEAYCHACLNQHPIAIVLSERAIKAGFATAEVLNNLGYNYLRRARFEEAQRCLTQAIEANDRLQAALHNRALVALLRTDRPDLPIPLSGISDIKTAIQLGPPSYALFRDAARLNARAAKFDQAFVAPALQYLRQAAKYGFEAHELKSGVYRVLAADPEFAQLQALPTVPRPHATADSRLIDPVPTLRGNPAAPNGRMVLSAR